jgi:transcription antitermination factor NusB
MGEKERAKDPAYRALRRRSREAVLQILYQEDLNPEVNPAVGDALLRNALELSALLELTPQETADGLLREPIEVDMDESREAVRLALLEHARRELRKTRGATEQQAAGLTSHELLALTRDPLADFVEHNGYRFAQDLLSGVRGHRQEIDRLIADAAANWSLQRISVTDRNVLRLGAYEILYGDTPPRVAINEAVELARQFGTAQSAPFVNGILDRLMREKGTPEQK